MYRVTICSAYLNHHNKPIYDQLSLQTELQFIATKRMRQERKELGYNEFAKTGYSLYAPSLNEEAMRAIDQCDVFIYGTAPEEFVEYAYKKNKIVLVQLERLFKQGAWKILDPRVLRRYYRKYLKEKNNPKVYYLCMSAYAGKDLAFLGVPKEKLKQWAYISDESSVLRLQKDSNMEKLRILWVGRFIWWKRPQDAIRIVKILKDKGCSFDLRMIGTGKKREKIDKLVRRNNLKDSIVLLGAMPPEEVYNYMSESDILLATSNRMEGWGVVVNEGMQHQCVVVGSDSMGAVPVLIDPGKTGYIYHTGNPKRAAEIICELQKNRIKMDSIKKAAKEIIESDFSINKVISVYMKIFDSLLSQGKWPEIEGILGSPAIKR